MRIILIFIIPAILSFMGCHSLKKVAAMQPATAKPLNSLTGIYWKLIELNGKPAAQASSSDGKEIFMMLFKNENRVSGNGGCNGFAGTYNMADDGFRIGFSKIMRTQMACAQTDMENEFFKVLGETDSYYITNNVLQLNRARMAALAKFAAVPAKNINE